jgi:hypothetical protein
MTAAVVAFAAMYQAGCILARTELVPIMAAIPIRYSCECERDTLRGSSNLTATVIVQQLHQSDAFHILLKYSLRALPQQSRYSDSAAHRAVQH